ncbi:hypothetical protein RUND412_010723 [Rhizina undulata]
MSSCNDSVLTAWELSFQALDHNARQLLHLCAFLSNEDIPEELFRRGKNAVDWIKEDETKLDDAIGNLLAFSLVKRKHDDSFSVDSLVHTWAREHNDGAMQQRNLEDAITVVASAIVTDEHKRCAEDWIFERHIVSHLKVCEEHISKYFSESDNIKVAEALSAIGYAYRELQYHKKAEEMCHRAIAVYEKALGKNHPSSLDTIHCLAWILYKQSQYDEALELYERVLARKEKAFGSDHSSIFNVLNDMALISTDQGRYEEALEIFQRALDGKLKSLGNDHSSTLETMMNIAYVFDELERYDEALQWYQKALAGFEKTLGDDHPNTLTTVHNIAYILSGQEKDDEALKWYQRALAGKEKTLGKNHTETLATVSNIANIFETQGKYDQALEWFQRLVAGREKTLGKYHASTLTTVSHITDIFDEQERHDEAMQLRNQYFYK